MSIPTISTHLATLTPSASRDAHRAAVRAATGLARLTSDQGARSDAWADAWAAQARADAAAREDARRIADAPRQAVEDAIAAVYPLRETTHAATRSVHFGSPALVATSGKASNAQAGVAQSYNRGWGVTASHHAITVPPDWLATVRDRGLAVIDGILTLSAERTKAPKGYRAWTAVWARQGRGTSVEVERGVLVGLGDVIVHARDIAAGVKLLAKRLGPAEARRPARRVTLALARRVGLCAPGALAWAERHLTAEEIARGWVSPERFRAAAAATSDSAALTARVLAAL